MRTVGSRPTVAAVATWTRFAPAISRTSIRLPAALRSKGALASLAIATGAAVVAAQFLASIVGAPAAGLTATATTAWLLLAFILGRRWQCCNRFTEAFGQAKRHGANAGQAFDVLHIAAFVTSNETHGDTFTTGTRGTADAVNILFGYVGQFEVEHVADAGDVDAARRDVGCDQNLDLPVTEGLQRCGALALRLVTVNGGGLDTGTGKPAHNAVGTVLGAGENQRAVDLFAFQLEGQQSLLFALFYKGNKLFNALCGSRRRGN